MGFEPMMPVLKQAKTFHDLNHMATVNGNIIYRSIYIFMHTDTYTH
jgi:hypothetical protein